MQDGGGCGRDWNDCWYPKLAHMDNSSQTIGAGLRKILSAFIRVPMSWSLIDAFTRLEEGEEAVRDADKMKDSDRHPPVTVEFSEGGEDVDGYGSGRKPRGKRG